MKDRILGFSFTGQCLDFQVVGLSRWKPLLTIASEGLVSRQKLAGLAGWGDYKASSTKHTHSRSGAIGLTVNLLTGGNGVLVVFLGLRI